MSSSGDSSLTLTATKTTPGSGGPQRTSPGSRNADAPPEKPDPCAPSGPLHRISCFQIVRITSPAGGPLTISDLAAFAPDPVAATSDPAGAGVAGLPTNFVAPATVHTRTGTLLDLPVTVRFTPTAFDFDYGDGTTTTSTTAGQTWTALHQPQFTPTATSHTYRDRGTYTTHVTVHYAAEVDLGNGWFPVDGELTIPGPTQTLRIYQATTALVQHTCIEQPTAPGC